jgi:hypothetical protein
MNALLSAARQYLAEAFDNVLAEEHGTEYAMLNAEQRQAFDDHVDNEAHHLMVRLAETTEFYMADGADPLPEEAIPTQETMREFSVRVCSIPAGRGDERVRFFAELRIGDEGIAGAYGTTAVEAVNQLVADHVDDTTGIEMEVANDD